MSLYEQTFNYNQQDKCDLTVLADENVFLKSISTYYFYFMLCLFDVLNFYPDSKNKSLPRS